MDGVTARAMTKSALALARTALLVAQEALPPYSHRNSPKKFTQHPLVAVLAIREFFHMDYRGVEPWLKDWSALRHVLDLKSVPDYSTPAKAHERLGKKGLSTAC